MKKKRATLIELEKAELIVTIEARFQLDVGADIDDTIERGLDALREQGEARVTARRVVGVPR